jgi:hypothetical protein
VTHIARALPAHQVALVIVNGALPIHLFGGSYELS